MTLVLTLVKASVTSGPETTDALFQVASAATRLPAVPEAVVVEVVRTEAVNQPAAGGMSISNATAEQPSPGLAAFGSLSNLAPSCGSLA